MRIEDLQPPVEKDTSPTKPLGEFAASVLHGAPFPEGKRPPWLDLMRPEEVTNLK